MEDAGTGALVEGAPTDESGEFRIAKPGITAAYRPGQIAATAIT